MPEVSVVIPSYNHAPFIGEAVESVLSQSLDDLELIVIDDGSTDNSLEVLNRFKDRRIQILTQENQGAHAAINRGLDLATGEYLAILNSDDIYSPDRLEVLVSIIKSNPDIDLAGSFIEVINAKGKQLGIKKGYQTLEPWSLEFPERSFRSVPDHRFALLTENYWATTSNFVFSRHCYNKTGHFRPLRYAHDWDFALRVAKDFHQHLEPIPLLKYRVHERNTIREDQAAMIFEICWILAVHIPNQLRDGELFDMNSQEFADQLLHSIYTFGFDRVLTVLLLMGVTSKSEIAEKLLNPNDSVREGLIDYIKSRLD